MENKAIYINVAHEYVDDAEGNITERFDLIWGDHPSDNERLDRYNLERLRDRINLALSNISHADFEGIKRMHAEEAKKQARAERLREPDNRK